MQDSHISNHLSEPQKQRYWDDGYLFPIPAISAAQSKAWRDELEEIERDWLDNSLPRPLAVYKRVNAHVVMPIAHDIAAHPAILDVVEGVLGPDILLYSTEFLIKEPNSKHMVTMHQDLAYWGLGEIDGIVTAWLALSPATRQSGCMDFVKASHQSPIIPHEDSFDEHNLLSRGQEIKVYVAEKDKTCGALDTGELSLHHGLMIHGSGPNTTDNRRIGVVIRYISPHVKKPNEARDYGVPLRGNCDTDNFKLCTPPKGLFHPDDLLDYETIRENQAAVMMAGAKAKTAMYS